MAAGCGGAGDTGPTNPGESNGTGALMLQEVASGLNSPVFLTHPPGDNRLFIVEQSGRIRIVDDGQLLGTPFLDIQNIVLHQDEQGLLSMAFHPDFATNGYIYVYHTGEP